MDFSTAPLGSIDFSPYNPRGSITLVLEESELRDIDSYRHERFVRVWHEERHTFAPCLNELVLVLRPSTDSSHKALFMEGINQILETFVQMSLNVNQTVRVYVDNWAKQTDAQDETRIWRVKYEQAPKLVFQHEATPEHASVASSRSIACHEM